MAAVQLSEYRENRLALLLSNSGPDDVYINTSMTDVGGTEPKGILLESGKVRDFFWVTHGELCWQIWWANCSRSTILAWEWFGTPAIDACTLTPGRTKFDLLQCEPIQIKRIVQVERKTLIIERRQYISKLLARGIDCDATH